MSDPYWRYATGSVPPPAAAAAAASSVPPFAPLSGESVSRSSLHGYLPTETSLLPSHHHRSPNDLQGTSSEYIPKDMLPLRPGAYGLEDNSRLGSHAVPGLAGLTPAISVGIPDTLNQRPSSFRKNDGLLAEESNIIFVDGLPSDCTRREVAHLFRPFIGFKEIRVVHKEPRRSRDKATVLCFVEFTDAKCALTAMEALQGYKFDDRKPDAPVLKIQYAHFPFHPPAGRD